MKRKLRILLVEDDAALGPITRYTLVHLGHAALLSTSAEDAYQHLSNPHRFDLVLLDLQLGERRSEPVIVRLRGEGVAVPAIVVFSAQPLDEIKHVVRHIGAQGYVQKPSSVEQIQEAIMAAV